jgi:hypothetical protein
LWKSKIVTVVQENVVLKDVSAAKFPDLLVLQAALSPQAVLESVRVEVNMNDRKLRNSFH